MLEGQRVAHSLRLKAGRAIVAGTAILACALLLPACSVSSPWDSVESSAELGIAYATRYIANQVAAVAEADVPLSSESIAKWGLHVMLTPESHNVSGVARKDAVYGLSEAGSRTELSIFVASTASTVQSGVSASSDVYGCGVLTVSRTTGAMRLADEECPDWILVWNGDDAQEVSVAGIAEKYEIDKEW